MAAKRSAPTKDSTATSSCEAKPGLAVDTLCSCMDVAEYKHVALRLNILRFMSDTHVACAEHMAAFSTNAAPLCAKNNAKLNQFCILATLRDTPLPKLLSGDLRLK